ncbi:hypothetical protein, partial [Paraburkholderia nemoris]|uniref:hypothetical protein n=1 Tax=Paraburkholderia nemoris TaxID=2793076 RepID=UPI001B8CDE91
MAKYQFTVKNYRCFSDASPARFVISRGMTSLLGVNNSGKSALLKMFQELRNVWGSALGYQGLGGNNVFDAQFVYVLDPAEVFCDMNERPMSIEIEILDEINLSGKNQRPLKKVILTCERQARNSLFWSLTYFDGDTPIPYQAAGVSAAAVQSNVFQLPNQGFLYSLLPIREMFQVLAEALYIGPFRNAITVGAGSHFDLAVGETFINAWNDWQNGPTKSNNRAINMVIENIRNVMGFSQLGITASMQSKTLQLNIDKCSRKIDLEFRAVSVQQFGELSVDGFFCPGDEASPV